MNSMKHGFRAQEKSFSLAFSDAWLARYLIIALVLLAGVLYVALVLPMNFLQLQMRLEQSSFFIVAQYLSNLIILALPIGLIYRTAVITTSKKIRSFFSKYFHINIIAVVVLELLFLMNSEKIVSWFPGGEDTHYYISSALGFGWGVLMFYMLPIVCLEDVAITQAFIRSAQALRATYKSALGLVICFYLIFALLGLPLSVFAIMPFIKLPIWLQFGIQVLVSVLAVGIVLIKSIAITLLYLDYTKQLPAHYLEK